MKQAKPLRLGKQMRKALWFISLVNGWHSFDTRDMAAVGAINSLKARKLVTTNKYNQFKITATGKKYVAQFSVARAEAE